MQLLPRPCPGTQCRASKFISSRKIITPLASRGFMSDSIKCTPLATTAAGFPSILRTEPPKPLPYPPMPTTRLFSAPAHHRSQSSNSSLSQSGHYNESVSPLSEPKIHNIFEPATGTWQYIVSDPSTNSAVIIDAVLDYNPMTQEITTKSADALLALIKKKGYTVSMILETHAHADHLTAASYLQSQLSKSQPNSPVIGIGHRISQVQKTFGDKYEIGPEGYKTVFGKLFADDETFPIGNLTGRAIHLPGHTPDHLGYMIGDNIFCGDSLFNTDLGTARADFPGGSAESLYNSGRKVLELPDHIRVWVGHDYPSGNREPVPYMTVAEHKRENKHLKEGVSEEEFVSMRKERDGGLAAPKLLHPSLQINIRGGRLPKETGSGLRLVHLPLRVQGKW
ncbi:MBL fold metallo-hydrolase [Aspergillus stella-maris]|uniref:MBL fold metallo-hydrolase n=1 Tax=Aspergillus stella-maris TaxID=1810926 RepID=UPI003CCCF23E